MKKTLKFLSLLLAVFAVACNTPDEPEQPENPGNTETPENPEPEQPADPNAVTMTDIRIDGILDIAIDFSVTVRNMDDYGYVLIPSSEYTEVDVDYVIANSLTRPYDIENTSWEEDLVIALSADTAPETEYVIVIAAKNSTSSVMKTTTATSLKQELVVEKISFNPTRLKVEHEGTTDHFLTLSSALYELRVHLVSEGFGGRYDNCDDNLEVGFVAEGTHFKELIDVDTWKTYGEIDVNIGNIDLYENLVTGKWEVFGTFCFAQVGTEDSWLTIEIEIPSGKPIEGTERENPYEFNFNLTNAVAEKDATNPNLWILTLTQDKDNLLTYTIDLGEDLEVIPSATYTNASSAAPKLASCSMIVNNVNTSLAASSTGVSSLTIEYNAETEESVISTYTLVQSGYSAVRIENAGPYKLYEEPEIVLTTYEEGYGMAIWTTWMDTNWELDCSGQHFRIMLYFSAGADGSKHLSAGRYILAESAPADGGLWIDTTASYIQQLGVKNAPQLSLATDFEDAYLDVTAEWDNTDEYWKHSIVGTLRSTNGAYLINFNYPIDGGNIY